MTATYADNLKGDGVEAIIIAGGCNDPNGNTAVVDDTNATNYYCGQITDKTFIFYPSTENILEVAAMPAARYRHSAAFVNGKLYIIGGRTLDQPSFDELAKDIIVYDPILDSWSTFMTLEDQYASSDQASFGKEGSIYMLGGYNANYDTLNDVFALNVETQVIQALASMSTKRGDANAVYYNHDGMENIFVMGGFTSETNFCAPLAHGEKYDFQFNTWSDIDPLVNKRGDKGVVVLNEKIVAIGGEDKHESICNALIDTVDPSSHAVAVDDVETYDPSEGSDAKWHVESDFPASRFRSAAAVSKKLNKIYVFGGQMAHDVSCDCYKTSTDIFYYRDSDAESSAAGKKIGFVLGVVTSAVMFVLW